MTTPLTIGTATFDDLAATWFTIQSLLLHHRDDVRGCEILVVDNQPGGPGTKSLKALVARAMQVPGVEAGFLDAEQAIYHEDRHLVSNVIGSPEMKIEIGPTIQLAPRDTVVLASDGLVDNLYAEEIVDRIRKGRLDRAADRLAVDARRRMTRPEAGLPSKPDDLTFVLFRRRV